jgi:hypothetical protein
MRWHKMKLYNNELERIVETKMKPNLKTIYNMRIKGLKDKQIAKFLGISVKMFEKAIENSEVVGDVYNDATLLLCSELRNVAISRALGTDGKTDHNGIEVGPDASLAVRLLEKLDPQFSKKEEVVVNVSIEDIISKLNAKRREELETKTQLIQKNEAKGLKVVGEI